MSWYKRRHSHTRYCSHVVTVRHGAGVGIPTRVYPVLPGTGYWYSGPSPGHHARLSGHRTHNLKLASLVTRATRSPPGPTSTPRVT
eukprot:2625908-Rhodomonas_salina.1